ncbi:MAG: hypothetical protein ACFB21_08400 [Opitutales bacterium]
MLFLLPLMLVQMHGFSSDALPALVLAWGATGVFGVVALGSGFLSQWRLKPGERHSMVLAVLGGALGLSSLFLSLFGLAGVLTHFLAAG